MTDETPTLPPAQESPMEPVPEDPNLVAARESWSEGEELAECPTCHSQKRKFLIVDDKCDSCRSRDQQAVFPAISLGWPEVRQRRNRLMEGSDKTVLPDRKDEVREPFLKWRQELRDITGKPDPMAAWLGLDLLEANRPKD